MAVLIEALSVVLRAATLDERYPGGWNAFRAAVPNNTLCADRELARVGFMAPQDAQAYVEGLMSYDIKYRDGDKARDLVVVDQRQGPLSGR